MLYDEKEITLKDGRRALLRSPLVSDAAEMLEFFKCCAAETEFIIRYPEECTETVDDEANFLSSLISSCDKLMIVCTVDGEIAGNCQLSMNRRIKTAHRASIAIALKQKFWSLGIGSSMFSELIHIASERGVTQLELDYVGGNERGAVLYKKFGFEQYGVHPDAIRLKSGELRSLILMRRKI